MKTAPGLPVILLVFSNEKEHDVDGNFNERYLRGLAEEKETIQRAIENANELLAKKGKSPLCKLVILEGAQANIQNICDEFIINEYRIVVFHYAGHADGYQLLLQSAEEGKTKAAHAGGLVAFFRQQRTNLKLIFLNGCETDQQAKEMQDAGIPTVIGTKYSINDTLAQAFAHRFYRNLALGTPLQTAWEYALSLIQTETKDKPEIQFSGNERGIKLEDRGNKYSWNLHSRSLDWNLGSEAKNPLFGLPPPMESNLPIDPFRYLERYQAKHAAIFFGRGQEIRNLFGLLVDQQEAPLILFHGQSGVGKSSVLEAGLFPRIQGRSGALGNQIIAIRRDAQTGLLLTLQQALVTRLIKITPDDLTAKQVKDWEVQKLIKAITSIIRQNQQGKQVRSLASSNSPGSANSFDEKIPKLVIMLDQAEESFTHPLPEETPTAEWETLLAALKEIQTDPTCSADVRVILSFRKEYFPEIKTYCQNFGIKWDDVFLKPLDEQGIREVVMGITSTNALQEEYGVQVKEFENQQDSLWYSMAEDLLEDKYSPISPILQIYLSELWEKEKKKKKGKREFTYHEYKKIKREGKGKLEKFFLEQVEKMKEEEAGASKLTAYIDAGLVLDLLKFHTTEMGTAKSCTRENLYHNYTNQEDSDGQRIKQEDLDALVLKLINHRLLLKVKDDHDSTRLAHDTLAPYVRKAFALSHQPGQRAAVLLENKVQEVLKKNLEPFLPENNSNWEDDQWKKENNFPINLKSNLGLEVLKAHINEKGITAHCTFANLKSGLKLKDNELQSVIDLLLKHKLLLKVDNEQNCTRLAHDTLAVHIRKATGNPKSTGEKPVLDSNRFASLMQKIKDRVETQGNDNDTLLLDPANLATIEDGKLGMRKWNALEKYLVEHNQEKRKKSNRQMQFSRVLIIGLGILIAGAVFWGLRNLAGGWEQNKLLSAFEYFMAAEEESEQGNSHAVTMFYHAQAYLYNFPHESSYVLRKMIARPEEIAQKPGALIAVDTIQKLLEHTEISPDGRFALSWEGTKAKLIHLGKPKDGPGWFTFAKNVFVKDLLSGNDTLSAVAFSPTGDRLGLATVSDTGGISVRVWRLGKFLIPEISQKFPDSIACISFAHDSKRMALGTSQDRQPIVVVWDFQNQALDTLRLYDSVEDNFESVTFSPDGKAIMAMRDSTAFMDPPMSYFWRFEEAWDKTHRWNGEFYTTDFHPEEDVFVVADKTSVIQVYDYSGPVVTEKSVIEFPGHKIETCLFNAEGEFIVQPLGNRSWLYDQEGRPKDVFEFENDLSVIQTGTEKQRLFFLCQDGEIYEAPNGISPIYWTVKNTKLDGTMNTRLRISSRNSGWWEKLKATFFLKKEVNLKKELPPSLKLSEILTNWHTNLERLFNLARFVMLLSMVNFLAHFYFSSNVWKSLINWINKYVPFVRLNYGTVVVSSSLYIISVFLVLFMGSGIREGAILESIIAFGSISMFLNFLKTRTEYRKAEYLSSFSWLAICLAWIFFIGYFTFTIDKYDLYNVQEFMEAVTAVSAIMFFLGLFNFVGHILYNPKIPVEQEMISAEN